MRTDAVQVQVVAVLCEDDNCEAVLCTRCCRFSVDELASVFQFGVDYNDYASVRMFVALRYFCCSVITRLNF